MSAPYSDNLYSSMADSDNDENQQQQGSQDFTAPIDGYFHASVSSFNEPLAGPSTAGPSHSVPYVPNLMVADPSLRPGSTIEDKAIGLGRDVLNPEARRAASPMSRNSSQRNSNPPVPERRLAASEHHQQSSSTRRGSGQLSHPHQDGSDRSSTTTYTPSQPSSPTMGRPEHHSSPSPVHSPGRNLSLERTANTPSEAPPAYSPRSPTVQTSDYRTFSRPTTYTPLAAMGLADEAGSLLGHPQGMGPPHPPRYGETVSLAGRNRRKNGLLGRLCLGLLTFMAVSFMLAAAYHFAIGNKHGLPHHPPPPLPPNEPVQPPAGSKDPDDTTEIPEDDQGSFPHSCCQSNSMIFMPEFRWPLSFSPSHSISIEQKTYETQGRRYHLGVYGAITVRSLPHSSTSNQGKLHLTIATNVNFPSDLINVSYDPSTQHLVISFPQLVDWASGVSDGRPCALVNATIWVPPSAAELHTLDLKSVQLDVYTTVDLKLNTQNMAIRTLTGHVTGAAPVASTSGSSGVGSKNEKPSPMPTEYGLVATTAVVRAVSGGIGGNWFLKDLLSFDTTSGHVIVGITPLESEEPATLNVKTVSGDQTVIEDGVGQSGGTVPGRDYMVDFESLSGAMEARVAFGSAASFSSVSGDVALTLLPVVDAARQEKEKEPWMELGTKSTSGDVILDVLEPQWFDTRALKKEKDREVHWGDAGDGDPYRSFFPPEDHGKHAMTTTTTRVGGGAQALKSLSSIHQSTSGYYNIKYPDAWEGLVTISTLAADVKLKGDGVHLIENRKGPGFGRWIVARRGEADGTSRAKIDTMSGDIKFEVV